MRRALHFLCAALVLTLVAVGCGGGGLFDGNNDESALRSRIIALFNDVNDEDLSGTMSHFSDDYLNDCFDWIDVRNEFEDQFNTPNYSEDWFDLDIDFSEVQGDFGYAEGTFTIRTNDDGFVDEDQASFQWDFVREGNRWVLIGNQQCNLTPQQQDQMEKVARFWLKGSARKK
jgi:hypothetical protein